MFSNSQAVFSVLAQALYRAGMYVGFADTQGGRKAWKEEMKALAVLLHVLQEQGTPEEFLHEIARMAEERLAMEKAFRDYPGADPADVQWDLAAVPAEVEEAVGLALAHFSKEEARLFADMVLASGASVAQSFDGRDEMFRSGDPVADLLTIGGNADAYFRRAVTFFERLRQDEAATYLYDSESLPGQMRISVRENDALGALAVAVRRAWQKARPGDLTQGVADYRRERGEI